MVVPTGIAVSVSDPILAALDIRYSIDADVIRAAIAYREHLLDEIMAEIAALQRLRLRLTYQQDL